MIYRIINHLLLFFLLYPYAAYCETDCSNSSASLSCLMENFDELYEKNYSDFWKILHLGLKEAKLCRSIEITSRYLSLAKLNSNNAEFNEFFAESIENFCLLSPKCFNEANRLLPKVTQEKLKIILNNPLFIDKDHLHKSGCFDGSDFALKLARLVLIEKYGKHNIKRQEPLIITETDLTWTVRGSLKPGHVGGVALIEIRKKDGAVIRVSHGK